ncbi:MAG: UDP-N-acetylglucosamine 2-epimerase, partial [Candidatus Riflebacteria bacterium]|nr:UDP-N-acetylglucosamine 2-epimerase [Candidatus Riflebacteria bacterium]
DPEGNEINAVLAERAVCEPSKIYFVKSLGRLNYLSAARYARCVIGNSSSGIAEIPAVGTPVVNIGRRQLGRQHGRAVISVACSGYEIVDAVKKAADPKFRELIKSSEKLYAGEDAAVKISEIIALLDFKSISREKVFFDC